MSPTLPQPAPLQVQTLEAGKGLARLAQAEQPLDRGSVLSRLGAGLQLRRCGSSLGPFQYRLARTRRQPNSSLPRAGTGHPGLAQSTAWSSLLRGWFPYAGAVLGSPNAHVKAPKHIHTSLLCNRAPGKPSRAGAFWAQTEDPSGRGAASPRQGFIKFYSYINYLYLGCTTQ